MTKGAMGSLLLHRSDGGVVRAFGSKGATQVVWDDQWGL